MPSPNTRSLKSGRNASPIQPVPPQVPPPLSDHPDLQGLISKRAYELHAQRGYREGSALTDWLDAEREILRQAPPA